MPLDRKKTQIVAVKEASPEVRLFTLRGSNAGALEGGKQISGRVGIDQNETRWRFTPDAAWRAGLHSIRISPSLEDACENTPYASHPRPGNRSVGK